MVPPAFPAIINEKPHETPHNRRNLAFLKKNSLAFFAFWFFGKWGASGIAAFFTKCMRESACHPSFSVSWIYATHTLRFPIFSPSKSPIRKREKEGLKNGFRLSASILPYISSPSLSYTAKTILLPRWFYRGNSKYFFPLSIRFEITLYLSFWKMKGVIRLLVTLGEGLVSQYAVRSREREGKTFPGKKLPFSNLLNEERERSNGLST